MTPHARPRFGRDSALRTRFSKNRAVVSVFCPHDGASAGLEMLYTEPGSPWENGFAESFFSRLRDELLNVEEFMNSREARWFAQRRLYEHNEERPHSSLGYLTPQPIRIAVGRFRSDRGCASVSAAPANCGNYNSTHTLITAGPKNGGIPVRLEFPIELLIKLGMPPL